MTRVRIFLKLKVRSSQPSSLQREIKNQQYFRLKLQSRLLYLLQKLISRSRYLMQKDAQKLSLRFSRLMQTESR